MKPIASQMKSRVLVSIAALCGAVSFSASALAAKSSQKHEFSGRIFSNLYYPFLNASDQRLQQAFLGAWLQGKVRTSDSVTGNVVLTAHNLERPKDAISTGTEFGVREAYVRYSRGALDFQAGKILLPWGKADAINPTDYFSAKDLQLFNHDEEVRRLGPTAAVLSVTPNGGASPVTFTAVAAPIFARSKLLIPRGLLSSAVTVNDPAVPQYTANLIEVGGKLSVAVSQFDFSLSAFRGWNHLPILSAPVVSGTTATVTPTFARQSAYGADFSWALGPFIVRGESAYRRTEASDGSNPFVPPASLESVLGIEKPFGDQFRMQLQGYYKLIPNLRTSAGLIPATAPFTRAAAESNALLHLYQFRELPGATARFAFTDESSGVQAEVFAMAYFPSSKTRTFSTVDSKTDAFVRPKISYEFATGLKGTLGSDHYFGSATRPFGAYRGYRSLFAEILYLF